MISGAMVSARNEQSEAIAESIVRIVRSFYRMKAAGVGARPPPYDPEYWALGILMKQDLPISELGKRLNRSKPSMTALIDKLMREGKVRRIPGERDRRVTEITITENGRRFMEGKKGEVKGMIKDSLSHLDEEDMERLSASLSEADSILSKKRGD